MREGITAVCCTVSDEQLQQFPHGLHRGFLSRAQLSPSSRGEPAPDTNKVTHANAVMVALVANSVNRAGRQSRPSPYRELSPAERFVSGPVPRCAPRPFVDVQSVLCRPAPSLAARPRTSSQTTANAEQPLIRKTANKLLTMEEVLVEVLVERLSPSLDMRRSCRPSSLDCLG